MSKPYVPAESADVITLEQFQIALERCMQEHPPSGEERRLHEDASRIADVWAALIISRRSWIARADVKGSALSAFNNWSIS